MSTQTKLPPTINCPGCQRSLPGWSTSCQFCGAPIGNNVPRPANAYQYRIEPKVSWQERLHTIFAVIWILLGGWYLLMSFKILPSAVAQAGGDAFLGIVGASMAGMGIGLLMDQDWMEFLAKMVCFLLLVNAGFGLMQDWLFATAGHKLKTANVVIGLVTMAMAGMQIYLSSFMGDT